jgi:hypothetical protein
MKNIHHHDRLERKRARKGCDALLHRMLATGHYWAAPMAQFNARHGAEQ